MDSETIIQKCFQFLKKNVLLSVLFFLGVIFLLVGLAQLLNKKEQQIEFQKGEDIRSASTSSESSKIVVDVSGEVIASGVYTLSSGARVQDAVSAAGGFSSDADKDYISRSVNLAAPIRDGMKIYIPKIGEVKTGNSVEITSIGDTTAQNVSNIISINSASQSELEVLPGIGPVSANKIINLRPYSSIEELLSKKAVGKSTFEKIKNNISL
ncbi:MAG: helix-hairpin-helix domain-containing protein [Candidatus Levybacteria bacterium]|nr:helix-hairpin-helix domain-containing protein [Candidatus Levybacteria bacterium]MBP9815226.1 helix-hairpin-helix domain-containing protein [Candidatus Levybacteria bacterium]